MARRLFTLASALSLLLCAAVLVLWIRSYVRPETFLWERCDSLSWQQAHDEIESDAGIADGPTADLTIEITLYPGGVRLWRERMLGATREIALDADDTPAKVSAPGWHFAGTFIATDRNVRLVGEPGEGVFGGSRLGFSQYLDSEEAPLWQFQRGPEGLSRPDEMVTSVSCAFWILFALTLICPAWWTARRGLALYFLNRRRPSGAPDARTTRDGVRERANPRPLVFASVLSLLVCLATLRLWVRSYWQQSQLECFHCRTRGPRLLDASLVVGFTRGELQILLGCGDSSQRDIRSDSQSIVQWGSISPPNQTATPQWRGTGFGCHAQQDFNSSTGDKNSAWTVLAPLWFVVLVLSILPTYALTRIVRLRRRAACSSRNRCTSCGYDLRATLDRCPECGTPVSPDSVNAVGRS